MRLMKGFSFAVLAALFLTACNPDLDNVVISRRNMPMDGGQEVPAKPGSGNGTIDYDFNKNTKTLSYTVKWNSLSGPITGFHIHGSAAKGFNAPIVQNFSGYSTAVAGTYSGTVFIDGVVINEEDLMRGGYYVNIHTALNPGRDTGAVDV